MSVDGRIATRSGDARWISGPEALRWAHQLRDVVDAVVVGLGTVVADDPRLTVRLSPEEAASRVPRPVGPLRVVLDSRCRLPLQAALLAPELAAPTLVCTTEQAPVARRAAIAATGAEVCILPADASGRVEVRAALAELGRRGLLHVLVEGGADVHASMLASGLADDIAVVLAPKLIGGRQAPGPVAGLGIERMADALALAHVQLTPLGEDVVIQATLPSNGRLAACALSTARG
jgi:diaminohydroxyphosphoribosylaminopyrimidine deaminase/5-amino-6-(5-phosphoribosylamino)uracil reductase